MVKTEEDLLHRVQEDGEHLPPLGRAEDFHSSADGEGWSRR